MAQSVFNKDLYKGKVVFVVSISLSLSLSLLLFETPFIEWTPPDPT